MIVRELLTKLTSKLNKLFPEHLESRIRNKVELTDIHNAHLKQIKSQILKKHRVLWLKRSGFTKFPLLRSPSLNR